MLGHGTRDPEGIAEFWKTVELVAAELDGSPVEGAFLEFAEPALDQAVDKLMQRGADSAILAPVFLFAAGHAKRDIPQLCEQISQSRRFLIRCARVLDRQPELLELSHQRFSEAAATIPAFESSETLLLMVGRGSSDSDAIEDMARFARLRFERESAARLEVCYLSLAQPSLDEGLQIAEESNFPNVIVQPHLLFSGSLLRRVREKVDQRKGAGTRKTWRVAGHLGPEPALARAICRNIIETPGRSVS